jgi:flavin reductase (DIM6/NTAB) family NADH-FMN oxidoreductase RutF
MFYEPGAGHGLARDPFKCLVVPRPIGWITTLDADGVVNLAPYSYFNAVGDDPPTVMFSSAAGETPDGRKDTWRNAERSGEFVCNMAVWDLREAMNKTSDTVPSDVDEAALAGLAMIPSRLVKPPRVERSPVHLECRYLKTVMIPQNHGYAPGDSAVVIGQVIGVHIDDALIKDGRVDLHGVRPIARLGYAEYTVVDTIFRMIPPWA